MFRYIIFGVLLSPLVANSAILVEEQGKTVNTTTIKKSASDVYGLRSVRKVGVGSEIGGASGLIGVHLEMNFSLDWSFKPMYGRGNGYQTFSLLAKHTFSGEYFVPYLSTGLTRWVSTDNGRVITSTFPKFLGKKLLSNREKRKGEFAKNLIVGGLGLQYLELSGAWAGSSLYAELTFLFDIEGFDFGPGATTGYTYYF